MEYCVKRTILLKTKKAVVFQALYGTLHYPNELTIGHT